MDAVKSVMETFKFAAGPPGLPGPNDGYVFKQGGASLSSGSTAVLEFTVFNDGITLEIMSSTNDLEEALSQFLELMWKLGFERPVTPPQIVLQSMITCEMTSDVGSLIPSFEPIAKAIAKATGAEAPHELKTIEYTVDPKIVPPLGSKVFRLDRRINEPFSSNRWFSFANATTDDHVGILELIEQKAKEAAN
jgi:hypothetical protein